MTSDEPKPPDLTPDAERHRLAWDAFSDEYQAKHAEALDWRGVLA